MTEREYVKRLKANIAFRDELVSSLTLDEVAALDLAIDDWYHSPGFAARAGFRNFGLLTIYHAAAHANDPVLARVVSVSDKQLRS